MIEFPACVETFYENDYNIRSTTDYIIFRGIFFLFPFSVSFLFLFPIFNSAATTTNLTHKKKTYAITCMTL